MALLVNVCEQYSYICVEVGYKQLVLTDEEAQEIWYRLGELLDERDARRVTGH